MVKSYMMLIIMTTYTKLLVSNSQFKVSSKRTVPQSWCCKVSFVVDSLCQRELLKGRIQDPSGLSSSSSAWFCLMLLCCWSRPDTVCLFSFLAKLPPLDGILSYLQSLVLVLSAVRQVFVAWVPSAVFLCPFGDHIAYTLIKIVSSDAVRVLWNTCILLLVALILMFQASKQ